MIDFYIIKTRSAFRQYNVENSSSKVKNGVFQVSVGYFFF